MLTCSGFVY